MEKELCKFYPKDHINEILKRLNSGDKHIRQSAILEGICYKYFLDKGFKIDIHPVMENNKRPDFKIFNEKVAFYLEAVVIAKNINKLVEEKKVTKYGELDLSYVLAACFYQEDNFLGEKDLLDALLGSRVYHKELKTIIRQKNGLWYSDRELRNTRNSRLSGVLYFDSIKHYSDFDFKPKLFINPWAKKPIDLSGAGINVINFDIKYMIR